MQIRISLESQAKLYVQDLIRKRKIELVGSFILDWENGKSRRLDSKSAIMRFQKNATQYIGKNMAKAVVVRAKEIAVVGVKAIDACHVACAEIAHCDYFLTTDDKLLRYDSSRTKLINPIDFVQIVEGAVL